MDMTRSRTALGLATLPAGALATAALSHTGLRLLDGSAARGGDPAAAISGLAATGAALIAGWLTLCLALTLTAELPGVVGEISRNVRDRVAPAVVQRWAAVILGASVGATIVPGTAVAAVQVSQEPAGSVADAPAPGWLPVARAPVPVTTSSSTPEPGWVPVRPPARDRTDTHLMTGRQRPTSPEANVVVRRGDTLWTIAATHLGPEATDVEIAREWPRWYEANTSAIGEDPHALLPGTVLSPPPAA